MKLTKRKFAGSDVSWLVLIAENESESAMIDETLGCCNLPIIIAGEVDLSDGYGEHYIRLRAV
jgi:hypothetical protein